MPKAEAGIYSGGLPLFECLSFDLAPQRPAHKNKNLTIFWCFIFSLQPYFQGFVQSCKIYLSCALCTFDADMSALCWLAKTDSPVNEGRGHCMRNSNSWDMTASSPSSSPRWMEHSQVFFICFMIKNSLNKFATHDFLIIISTTNFIFKVNESVINMFYTLIHVKYT